MLSTRLPSGSRWRAARFPTRTKPKAGTQHTRSVSPCTARAAWTPSTAGSSRRVSPVYKLLGYVARDSKRFTVATNRAASPKTYTSRMSFSLRAMIASTSVLAFWMISSISFRARSTSSSPISLVLLEALEHVLGVVARLADRDLGVFAGALAELGELLAALLGERRHRHADDLAVVLRVEPERRLHDAPSRWP